MVVDLAGRARAVQLGEFCGGAAAAEDLAQQPQPYGLAERRERLGGVRPVALQHGVGVQAVLPLVALSGRDPYGAGEEHSAVVGAQLGELDLEAVQGPQVVVGLALGRVGGRAG